MGNISASVESRESDRASGAHGRMGQWAKMTDDMGRGIGTAGHSDGGRHKEIIINELGPRDAQDKRLVRVENHYKHFGSG